MTIEKYVGEFFREYQYCFVLGDVIAIEYSDKQIHDYIESDYYYIYIKLKKEYDDIYGNYTRAITQGEDFSNINLH